MLRKAGPCLQYGWTVSIFDIPPYSQQQQQLPLSINLPWSRISFSSRKEEKKSSAPAINNSLGSVRPRMMMMMAIFVFSLFIYYQRNLWALCRTRVLSSSREKRF